MQSSGFPGAIGAIDCTHVEIIAPPEPADVNYIDRRGDYSLNVQLVSMTGWLKIIVNKIFNCKRGGYKMIKNVLS